ncbi:MAG TPA: hypothetical protein VGL53_01255 [Bryobacteraceae bacterium]
MIPLLVLACSAVGQTPRTFLHPHPSIERNMPEGPTLDLELPGTTAATLTRDGSVWLGTGHGLWRVNWISHRAHWQYFAGRRYLPSDAVKDLLPDKSDPHSVWVSTAGGTVRLGFDPMTLEAKASLFEQRVELRHNRHGMVADSHLARAGDPSSNVTESSDNDGLWTAMYGASQCFRYSVTHDEEAHRRAVRSVEALLTLERITGIPGFPARSFVKPNEVQPSDGVWYDNPSEGLRWKADTSSDEIVGHFFLFSIAFDTLPDVELKHRIAATARRIMDHILSHGYYLIDTHTGKPTSWGKWSPAYFATKGGRADSPLNAVELLSFLRATRHITGDAKYDAEYRKVAHDMGYAEITARYREYSDEINYSDEELAMLSFYTLFRYEKDPALLPIYRKALDGWWYNIRRERNPLWNLIYLHAQPGTSAAALTAESLATLAEIPLDLVTWTVDNSRRRDIEWDRATDRFQVRQTTTWLSPGERPVMKWNGNPFVVNGGDGGNGEDDGSFYLLPYWLGRYWRAW